MEQGINTGQLFLRSKFAGVASTATAFGGTGFPPCAAYDFSSVLRGTLAWTVEPGERGTSANLKEGSAAFAVNIETTCNAAINWTTKSNLFKQVVVRMSPRNQQEAGFS